VAEPGLKQPGFGFTCLPNTPAPNSRAPGSSATGPPCRKIGYEHQIIQRHVALELVFMAGSVKTERTENLPGNGFGHNTAATGNSWADGDEGSGVFLAK
jgi:hypothetical protein